MKDPKRIPQKKKLAPKEARTFGKICSLETDHCDTRNSWMCISEHSVHIYMQKPGHEAKSSVSISRKDFEKFIDWYNKKQQTVL